MEAPPVTIGAAKGTREPVTGDDAADAGFLAGAPSWWLTAVTAPTPMAPVTVTAARTPTTRSVREAPTGDAATWLTTEVAVWVVVAALPATGCATSTALRPN